MARGRKAARYSTLPPGALGRFAIAKGENPEKPANRLFEYVSSHARRGDNLKEVELRWLNSWLVEHKPGTSPREVWTFQASNDQMEEIVSPDARRNWLARFSEAGLLIKVHDGIKGHGSLYVIAPDEVEEKPWHKYKNLDDLENAGVDNHGKSYPQKGADSSEWGAVSDGSGVGSKHEELPHPLPHPLNNSEKPTGRTAGSNGEPSRPVCPRCGSTDVAVAGEWRSCRSCSVAF